ncbi:MAG: sensor histidine kinase [Polyangiales bacterium]
MLVGMSGALADPDRTPELLALLARAAIEVVGATAAVVLEIDPGGQLRIVASEGTGHALEDFVPEPDLSGVELAAAVVEVVGGARGRAKALPIASGGDLYGWWVLLFDDAACLDADQVALAAAIVELVATGLGRAKHVRDLSRYDAEIRASRDALAQAQKLRILGEMAAGISHDLKNILAPLSLHLQFLQRAISKDDVDAQGSIKDMRDVVRRGVETIDRLRSFSRQSPVAQATEVDLDELAREAIRLCAPRLRSQLDLHVDLVDKLGGAPRTLLNATDAVSAIVNLIVNAIDAMQACGGTIVVTSGARDGGAWLRVADDGPGMSAEVQHRVFEPFFTTKGQQGTGLGLAMVFAFVQRHRGVITLDSTPGQGAAFTLWFPTADRLVG